MFWIVFFLEVISLDDPVGIFSGCMSHGLCDFLFSAIILQCSRLNSNPKQGEKVASPR